MDNDPSQLKVRLKTMSTFEIKPKKGIFVCWLIYLDNIDPGKPAAEVSQT